MRTIGFGIERDAGMVRSLLLRGGKSGRLISPRQRIGHHLETGRPSVLLLRRSQIGLIVPCPSIGLPPEIDPPSVLRPLLSQTGYQAREEAIRGKTL
jgi:hypothetical protein